MTSSPLHEVKAGIKKEFRVASYHEVQVDGGVSARPDSPEQELHQCVVFIPPTAVVSMQAGTCLARPWWLT